MNRYEFNTPDEEAVKEIRVGMKFVSDTGGVATVIARLPRNEWTVDFNNINSRHRSVDNVKKNTLLKQLEECKKPNSGVKIVYE